MDYVKQNFNHGDMVKIVNVPSELLGKVGIVIGKTMENVIDHYIVIFPEILSNGFSAISITEVCLHGVEVGE